MDSLSILSCVLAWRADIVMGEFLTVEIGRPRAPLERAVLEPFQGNEMTVDQVQRHPAVEDANEFEHVLTHARDLAVAESVFCRHRAPMGSGARIDRGAPPAAVLEPRVPGSMYSSGNTPE